MGKDSQYKYVSRARGCYHRCSKEIRKGLEWVAAPRAWKEGRQISLCTKQFKTEREAALYVDRKFIEHGLEPVNIIKRKTTQP